MESEQIGQKPLSFKLTFKKKRDVGKDFVRLEHTENGHNKFYTMELVRKAFSPDMNFTVVIKYGRIGTAGSDTRSQFKEEKEAYKFINSKLGEKLAKGYKKIAITNT